MIYTLGGRENMTIPSYEEMMLPVLLFTGDGKEHSNEESVEYIKNFFNLNDEDVQIPLRSGGQSVLNNRAAWARTYLKQAGLITSTQRARFMITELGMKVLKENPKEITDKYLMKFPGFQEFQKRHKNKKIDTGDKGLSSKTPLEILEDNYLILRSNLADELLSNIAKCSPAFFENLVVELLVGMGYGGTLSDAGQTVGKSGDGGIDGIIKEDKLGLDVVYIQAKRWEGTVGSKEIRNFVGALAGHKANKGVFITTSKFTQEALSFTQAITPKVILIDGEFLANLMIDYDIGVSQEKSFQIKRVDQDFFEA
jgi:restriction system protein